MQWVPGALSLGVRRPGLEADHTPPSSDEVKECVELYLHSHNTPSWRGARLKAQGQLYLYFRLCNNAVPVTGIIYHLLTLLTYLLTYLLHGVGYYLKS
jgi:hypothetical protein